MASPAENGLRTDGFINENRTLAIRGFLLAKNVSLIAINKTLWNKFTI